ncbi:MAG: Bax inhibitor-1/YccA family protein [Proteobacteria bacterium]|uniref:Bax inhibitor-1/YccA family protein n=1 Tax=Candidatus Avisuccinivibrio stercorigallinarum TaxID=2840704 RepID=A0A9D9GSQ9_9GAMM|nr:Bax inhibitor-1/YccA family protein [Candidatus Avisuccinivibrio stercorigallinarum]
MHSTNPAAAVLARSAGQINFGGVAAGATMSGTTSKALLYCALTVLVGYWAMTYSLGYIIANLALPKALMFGSLIAGVVLAFVTLFNPKVAPITAPIYAVLEGAALGSVSAAFELKYPGIVSTAVLSTFAVVMAMLVLWKFRLIVPTARFRAVVTGALTGIVLLYIANLIFSLFGSQLLPSSGPVSIGISLIICTVAALSLVLDFDTIEQSVEAGLPKYFEAFNAFSLLITICWLYVEILNLLSKRE